MPVLLLRAFVCDAGFGTAFGAGAARSVFRFASTGLRGGGRTNGYDNRQSDRADASQSDYFAT